MNEMVMSGESKDLVSENILIIKKLFPEVITEDKIDFDKLKLILGSDIETENERYSFSWPGKNQAIKESQKLSYGTLRPYKKESKNWDTTKNLYIEGDNLEVLKLLQKGYYKKVKMILIDPPYNTGNEFVYLDDYKDNLENYLKITNQMEDGFKLSSNTETSGHYHSNWLNMMYPRLKLARNLLKDDGVLVINIDDNEIKNLLTICEEIFGKENIDCAIWQKVDNDSGKMKITYRMRLEHEYVVFCYRNKSKSFFNKFIEERNYKNEYTNPDNDPRGPYKQAIISSTEEKSNKDSKYFYDVVTPSGKVYSRQWRVEKWEMDELIKDNRIYFGKNGDSVPSLKAFINEPKLSTPTTLFSNVGTAKTAGKLIEDIMGDRKIFSYPKPVELIKHLLRIVTDYRYSLDPNKSSKRKVFFPNAKIENEDIYKDEIILDFFSGSATTAHAVMELNNEDNLNRKFIMVQLPELTSENSKPYKEGYENICEIGKERIRRAGKKIVQESGNKTLDIGFKVFKLDSSNLEKWDPDYDNLEQTLLVAQDNIKADRTQEDLIYEIMLKYGIDLTLPIAIHETSKNTIYSIGFGALLICLDEKITQDISEHIIKLSKDSEITRVVFKDNGFASDSDKTNVKETLRSHHIDEFITI